MVIEIDRTKWELPSNRLPQRHHSAEKQTTIRTQVDALLKLGVIEESRATHFSQVHPVLKSPGKWRLTLDFVRLNAAMGGLEGCVETPHGLHGNVGIVPMDPSCNGTERIWPLLPALHVEHGPSGVGVSNLRALHR